nr:Tp2 CD8+ T cell antigen [Theileria parva]
MKLAARLISLYFIIFILHSSVLGGNCSDEELENLGLLEGDGSDKNTLFLSSHGMGKVGKRFGLRPTPKVEKVLTDLKTLFAKLGLAGVSEDCLKCFAQSLVCVLLQCRGACLKGPCTDDCQNCFNRKCKSALLECIGKTSNPNPCKWKEDYLKFKFPETGEDESTKKGEASGTS